MLPCYYGEKSWMLIWRTGEGLSGFYLNPPSSAWQCLGPQLFSYEIIALIGDDCYRPVISIQCSGQNCSPLHWRDGFFILIKLSLSTKNPANMTGRGITVTGFRCITIQYHISSYLSMKPFITRGGGERLKSSLTGQPWWTDCDNF